MIRALFAALLALAFFPPSPAGAAPSGAVIVKVHNSLDITRPSETIVLKASDLMRLLGASDVRRVHVQDQQTKRELLVQAVDDNDDGVLEEFVFQTDMGPRETKSFRLTVGERPVLRREDFKAYGRFVRERRDDFAWENDRIAHRMYGTALETWAQEPLTSSAVDVWTKRVPRLVINDWYMVGDYHNDQGEGGDFYSAGSTRGCGGNGIWADGRLYPSANFRNSRVLANGPIRLIFELMYDTWDAHGARVSEVKRITLDAGQNFNRFESHYTIEGSSPDLQDAIGIRKAAGSVVSMPSGAAWMRTWESLPQDEGQLGIAAIVDPVTLLSSAEDKKNYLLLVKVPADSVVTYYAGFGWNKSGQFRTVEDWDRYVRDFATRLRTPLDVTLATE
jgi:hypothetical protein